MEYGFSRKQQIEEKLAEDNRKLSILKESLAAADTLTNTMVSILNQFDERLLKLEETILPVHRKTKDLQRMRDNIEKTVSAFDHVIRYHHVPRTVEPVLRRGPNRQVDHFIDCMVELSDAVKFFTENNPDSPELNNVVQLFDIGKDSLKKEFQNLLVRHTRPAHPPQLLQAVKESEGRSIVDEDSANPVSKLVSFPVKATNDISKIANWLLSNGKSSELKKTYAEIRSTNLLQELLSVKEYVREKGLQGSSPRKFSTAKDTPKKTTRRAGHYRKASAILRKDSVHSVSSGGSKSSGLPVIIDEDAVEIELEPFLSMITCAERLFEAEFTLLSSVIPNDYTVFNSLIQDSLGLLEQDGSKFVVYANQCVIGKDHPQVVNIFPAINHLKSKLPGYVVVLKDTSEISRSKIPKLIGELDSTASKVLEDFTDSVKSDPAKESNMPKDGTVHELTSNVMLFLQQLAENQIVVGSILASQHHGSHQTGNKGEECLSQYMGHVLGALKLNLENKSRFYVPDFGLAAIFLLNNYNFILSALNRHGLLELIQKSTHDINSIYTSVISEQKKRYLGCWDKFTGYLSDDNKQGITINAEPGSRLKDKEKQVVKEKLKSFNNDLDDLVKVHKMWAVPDVAIRKELHDAVKKMIVPSYSKFRDRYRMVQFTKNIEKYLKHTPEDVERLIHQLFDQA